MAASGPPPGSSPGWLEDWLGSIVPLAEVLAVLAAAYLLALAMRIALRRLCERYDMPPELAVGARRIGGGLIYAAALLLALELVGVSGAVLWTALTGFAAVGAVAFFAAWSVLSNIFCSFLIFTVRPFRLHDRIELVENADKPGIAGRVVDINLIYTTLQEQHESHAGALLRVPNSLFFQRMTRRWQDSGVDRTR